jgi:hypothetical protein
MARASRQPDAASAGQDAFALVEPDASPRPCAQATCPSGGTRFCGRIGDDCAGVLDCGGCPDGQVCGAGGANVCSNGYCTPIACAAGTGRYCGRIGDGCAGSLDCGGCPDGGVCGGDGIPGLCPVTPPAGCQPVACASAGGRYCGRIGDGCGRVLECGAGRAAAAAPHSVDASVKVAITRRRADPPITEERAHEEHEQQRGTEATGRSRGGGIGP